MYNYEIHRDGKKRNKKNFSRCSPTHGTQPPMTAGPHTPGREIETQTTTAVMPKNKSKNRCRGKNENESEIRE